jgi:hypothetical protein
MVYVGYRVPVLDSEEVDLETVVWLDFPDNVTRNRAAPTSVEHEDGFQGKISFYLRWHVANRAELVLSPSFELDRWGWGGGAVQLRYRF